MADYVREWRAWVDRPRAEVFAFFADPRQLPALAPPSVALDIVDAPPALSAGAVIELRLRWLGIPLRWRAFIREYDAPVRFVDVQVRGPFARWEHRHMFLTGDGGTWIEDRITYRLPFGPLGRAAHAVGVGRQLDAIWRYRERRIAEKFGPVTSAAG
jgi:ligand-binding SRPBCC domain-containing protein